MEDVKWMFRKCGFPILIFLFVVIVGTVCWEKLKTEKPQSVAEEVWEPFSVILLPNLLAIRRM